MIKLIWRIENRLGTRQEETSDNAVDGLYSNRSDGGNQCAISFASEEVTWLVDLEAIYSICRIVLYHRVEGTEFGECTIIVFISSQKF